MSKTPSGPATLGSDATRTRPTQAAARMLRQRKTALAKPRRAARKSSPTGPKRRTAPSESKQDVVIQLLRRQSGATIEDIIANTGWQPHSVRGFFSGLIKKKLKLPLVSEVGRNGLRRYHITPIGSAKA